MRRKSDLPAAAARPRRPRGARWRWRIAVWGVAIVAAVVVPPRGPGLVADGAAAPDGPPAPEVDRLIERAERLGRLWRGVERYHEQAIAPIERVLLRYRDDPALARRVALALVTQANAVELEPRLLLAVLLVENPWLDPKARSPVGAVGLMQVMPEHRGNWPPCGPDLEDVEANICYGARIFARIFRETEGDVERALLRYNGCVRGTNTPNCHTYPTYVYARAGRASILAWLRPPPPPPDEAVEP
ncbi:MAG TPA: lytic transglycosylase domain-containing protein [Longimicrobiales bacterium]